MTQTATVTTGRWEQALAQQALSAPERRGLEVLQLNLGLYCNQTCGHCHVDAGPRRRDEVMSPEVRGRVLEWITAQRPPTLDLTGGAPELIPGFRALVRAVRPLVETLLVRSNLTSLLEPGQEDLEHFLAEQRVGVVASLPCYTAENVDGQRGRGVFERSIEALRRLNAVGYGDPARGLLLRLVYNPGGAFLPGLQGELEADYRARLAAEHGLVFSDLVCLTNMPISRFARSLVRSGTFQDYWTLLESRFNRATLPELMCRSTLSVDHHGRVYDCDFNQVLGLPLGRRPAQLLWELAPEHWSQGARIACADHCLGCTAGAGSSCGGALL